MTVLEGIRLRLERAAQHLQELEIASKTALHIQSSLFDVKYNGWEDSYSLYILAGTEIDQSLSVILGDYVHDLRSSLDNLITHLVGRNGKTPEQWHCFPLYRSEGEWINRVKTPWRRDKRSPLRGISPFDFALIEELQSYRREAETEVMRTDLEIINRVSNADKHRALHACLPVVPELGDRWYHPIPEGTHIDELWVVPGGTPLEDETEIVRLKVTPPPGFVGDVEVNPGFPVGVSFRDETGERTEGSQLVSLWETVSRVIFKWDPQLAGVLHPQLSQYRSGEWQPHFAPTGWSSTPIRGTFPR